MEDSEDEDLLIACAATLLLCQLFKEKERKKRKRRFWVTPLFQDRHVNGKLSVQNGIQSNPETGHFHNFARMAASDYEQLITLIGPSICKKDTNFRKAITVNEKLALTLRFLATGDTYKSIQGLFKISQSAISFIVPAVCDALVKSLSDYIALPTNFEQWTQISTKFEDICNFPNCIGAIQGRHIVVQSSSSELKYKGYHSIVLLAVADAEYNFLYAGFGAPGSVSDGSIFKNSKLREIIDPESLNQPKSKPLGQRQLPIPYVILGDSAFPLTEHLMTPYPEIGDEHSPEQIFNYRLNSARQVVEDLFRIISSIFGVLQKPLLLDEEKSQKVVLAAIYLHNFLRKSPNSVNTYFHSTLQYLDENETDVSVNEKKSQFEKSFLPLDDTSEQSLKAAQIREEFTSFFMNEGVVSSEVD